jgi:SpoVK/Ycf46/Vps4 family AAA+-type ATPase
VSPTDIEEGMRVGVDRQKYSIQLPLPPKIDPSVTMMQVEDKPDVTYSDVGGCKEQIERLREVVEVPLLSVFLSKENLANSLARTICEPGYRSTKGCNVVWSSRNREDLVCKSSCK